VSRLLTGLVAITVVSFVASAGELLSSASAMSIEQVTGASGIKASLVADHSLPLVTVRFAFPAGAASDPAGKGGTAQLVSELLDEGAGPYDAVAYQRRLQKLASDLEFSVGKDTFEGSLRSLKGNLTDTAELLRLALAEPRFTPDAIERLRVAQIAKLQQNAKTPIERATRLLMDHFFHHHPYGRSIDGNEASVASITRDDLTGFVAPHFHRTAIAIGIVGDVTAAEAAILVDKIFGGLAAGTREVETEIAEAKALDDGALLFDPLAVPQGGLAFGQRGPKRDDPRWYPAFILNEILGGSEFQGRLMQEIREKRGLAYDVSTELVTYRHAGMIMGKFVTDNRQIDATITLIRQQWQRMRDHGPTAAELTRAKSYLIDALPLSLSSTQEIARFLVKTQLDKFAVDYLDRRSKLIGAVTLDQARTIARTLLEPTRLTFTVVADPAHTPPIGRVPVSFDGSVPANDVRYR